MTPNAWFFCSAGAILLVASIAGTLLSPRNSEPDGAPRRRGTMPPWAVAIFGLSLASFALAVEWPRVALFVAAPFLLMWLLPARRSTVAPAAPRPPRGSAAAAVLASLPPHVQAALAAAGSSPPRPRDFEIIASPPAPEPPPAQAEEWRAPWLVRAAVHTASVLAFGEPLEEPRQEEEDDGSMEAARQRAMDRSVIAVLFALFAIGMWQTGHRLHDPVAGFLVLLLFYTGAAGTAVACVRAAWSWGVWLVRRTSDRGPSTPD
jgi:hypothetical protein